MRFALAIVLAAPITVTDKCGNVDEPATCRKICEVRLKKRIYHSEVVGKSGDDEHRICACYPERIVITEEGDPLTPEKQ